MICHDPKTNRGGKCLLGIAAAALVLGAVPRIIILSLSVPPGAFPNYPSLFVWELVCYAVVVVGLLGMTHGEGIPNVEGPDKNPRSGDSG